MDYLAGNVQLVIAIFVSNFKCYKTQKFKLYSLFDPFYISLYMKTNKKTLQAKYLSIISLYYSIFSAYSHLQTKIYDLRNTK